MILVVVTLCLIKNQMQFMDVIIPYLTITALEVKTIESAHSLDPDEADYVSCLDEAAHMSCLSGSTQFDVKYLNSQYEISWTKRIFNFCKMCTKNLSYKMHSAETYEQTI